MKNQDVYVACYLDGTESLFYSSKSGIWYDLILGEKISSQCIQTKTLKHFWDTIYGDRFPSKYLLSRVAVREYKKDRNQILALNKVFITKECFCHYYLFSFAESSLKVGSLENAKQSLRENIYYSNKLIYKKESGKYIDLETNKKYNVYQNIPFCENAFLERYPEEIIPFPSIMVEKKTELEKKEILKRYRKYLENQSKYY